MADKKMKAIGSALRALADAIESDDAPDTKPAAAAKKKDAAAGAAAAATTGAGNGGAPASPADVANRTSAAAGTGAPAGGDIMTQARQAAKSYAEVYGREGLKEVLSKYTQGTLADVAADRLPDLLKELS